jgi:hypothetical protein
MPWDRGETKWTCAATGEAMPIIKINEDILDLTLIPQRYDII